MNKQLTLGKSLLEISYNPYYLSELIITVVNGFTVRTCNLMDTYAFLPLLLYQDTRITLEHTNANGSIYKLFLKNNKKALAGINTRLSHTKKLTNESVLVAITQNKILFNDTTLELTLSAEEKKKNAKKRMQLKGIYNSANNLGKIISKKDTTENYRILGVNKI